ncbi:MAG: hypothetical protein OJF59_000798 [Cytophagales bacterium]|nr:MAG: hypothetical protein OJF59_000798 [Cytophagales bacterium]
MLSTAQKSENSSLSFTYRKYFKYLLKGKYFSDFLIRNFGRLEKSFCTDSGLFYLVTLLPDADAG